MDVSLHELLTQQKIIKDRIRGVIHGESNGMYLHGRPGTSKTYMIRSTLETQAVHYAYANGHLTPIGLFDLIEANQDRIIVLDDVASIFNQPIALQLLLAALGTSHDGSRNRLVRYKTAKEDRIVFFSGGIICISNLPLAGHNHEVLHALRDRVNVIGYEPSDDQMIAQITAIASTGPRGLTLKEGHLVADFLINESKLRDIRPSVRLYMDKAIVDFRLWKSGKSETHWQDLIRSTLQQQTVELTHEVRDLSRAESIEAERRIAHSVYLQNDGRKERIAAWMEKTGKGQSSFYRRVDELKKEGRLLV